MNYFNDTEEDLRLVRLAKEGKKEALETLVKNNQEWIFNLALRMVGNSDDASDITQEILIKLITKLSTFQERSSFKTWLYRIAKNHILNMKRCVWERYFNSFEQHERFKNMFDEPLPEEYQSPLPDQQLLLDETRMGCITGMLLCLDRTQRIVFILGGIFNINSKLGADIMETSAENFRQLLSRARKQLSNYMNDKCGLINENNPCRCAAKTKALIKAGFVDPEKLRFNRQSQKRIQELLPDTEQLVEDALEIRVQNMYREQQMHEFPEAKNILSRILECKPVRDIINFS